METLRELSRLMLGSERLPGGCWRWSGSVTTKGYAQTKTRPAEHAHRFVFRLFRGEIPEGAHLHHICKEKRCLNPAHLEVVRPIVHAALHKAERRCRRCGGPLSVTERQRYGDGWRDVRRCPPCRAEQLRAAYLRRERTT